MNTSSRLSLAAVGLVLSSCSPPADVGEYCRQHFSDSATVIVVDRTTKWNSVSTKRFDAGVENLISSDNALGNLSLAEFREATAMVNVQQLGVCLLPNSAEAYKRLSGRRHGKSNWFSWWASHLPCNRSTVDEHGNATKGECLPTRSSLDTVDRTSPTSAISLVTQAISSPIEPTKSTEIVGSLTSIIADTCASTHRCALYIFSDMLDSRVKKRLFEEGADPRKEGELLANAANEGRSKYTGRLTVVIWGFGRDDYNAAHDLSPEQRAELEVFWNSYFANVVDHGACVKIADSLIRPPNLPFDGPCP